MREWASRHARLLLAMAVIGLITLQVVSEVAQMDEPVTAYTVAGELLDEVLPISSAVVCVLLILQARAQAEESLALRSDLRAVRGDAERWRREMAEHLQALGSAIRRQFAAWRLTDAEQEVGLLLLKGLSHKEIARVRRTSEATIRQQATAIYQKAGLGGRAALSAFFLDDLLGEVPIVAARATDRQSGIAPPMDAAPARPPRPRLG